MITVLAALGKVPPHVAGLLHNPPKTEAILVLGSICDKLNAPGQGLFGDGKVSNNIKYVTPAVKVTSKLFVLKLLAIPPTQVLPAVVGQPLKTEICVQV
jgi:hypothetical protein